MTQTVLHSSALHEYSNKNNWTLFSLLLLQGNSSPRPIPSSSALSRHATVRPAGKPPPIPAYSAEQNHQKTPPQMQPLKSNQRQRSPQGLSLPPFKSEQKRNQAPPPPSGPPPLNSLCTKPQAQHLLVPKHRPDPPRRPPPPCPVSNPSLVSIFLCVCVSIMNRPV